MPLRTMWLLACCLAAPTLADTMSFQTVSNGGNCNACQWRVAEGDITAGTSAALRAHLTNEQWPGHIEFVSRGENLGAALGLGRVIREHGLAAAIGLTRPGRR